MFPFNPTHPSTRGPISSARPINLLLSYYAPDWIITIVLVAVIFLLENVDGFRRDFSLEDTSLRHPFAVHERVPDFALYMIAVVSPLVIMTLINIVTVRSWWDSHNATLGTILGLLFTGALTQLVKITVGRPRPDVIDRCQPPAGLSDPLYRLTNSTICTQANIALLRDGFRSFPSGHSSLSFAGLGFLGFYLAGKLHLFDDRGHTAIGLTFLPRMDIDILNLKGKAWIPLGPFVAAALVAISRTMDHRHHWQDVLAGAILGTVLAYFSYRQYYPSLVAKNSHRPYAPRIKREDTGILPTHNLHTLRESHDGGSYVGYHDPEDAFAGTVPRPDIENVDEQSYRDRFQLGSQVAVSNDAPNTLNSPKL